MVLLMQNAQKIKSKIFRDFSRILQKKRNRYADKSSQEILTSYVGALILKRRHTEVHGGLHSGKSQGAAGEYLQKARKQEKPP